MPYKINKIIFQREWDWGYETFTYDLNTEIDFPYVAGKLNLLVPNDYSQIKKHRPDVDDFPLFNESGLTKLIPEVGPKGIYYLELRPGYKLKQLIVEPEDVVVDIYIGAKDTLIYSFYNPTRKNHISITASSEKDKDSVHAKLKSDPTDIYWRQYFIRVAMDIVDIKKFDVKVSENMTAEQVADYLQVDKKTIRKWTSERKIPNVKLGGAVRYQKERIDAWLKSNEKKVVRGKVSK